MGRHRHECLYVCCDNCANEELEVNYWTKTAKCPRCLGVWSLEWDAVLQYYEVNFDDCVEEPEYNSWDFEEEVGMRMVDGLPECCASCGGPYPNCMTSCKIFDD